MLFVTYLNQKKFLRMKEHTGNQYPSLVLDEAPISGVGSQKGS